MHDTTSHAARDSASNHESLTIENPFAVQLRERRWSARHALNSAAKMLLLAGAAFACVTAVNHYGQDWLMQRQTIGFEQLSPAEKSIKLVEIAGFGTRATPKLVASLLDPELSVARTATRLLQDQQQKWTILSPDASAKLHTRLLQQLHRIANELPRDRTSWANEIVQTSLANLRRNPTWLTADVKDLADITLRRLSLTSGLAVAMNQDTATEDGEVALNRDTSTIRIVSKTEPLPIEADWIDAEFVSDEQVGPDSVPAPAASPSTQDVASSPARIALKAIDPVTVDLKPVVAVERTEAIAAPASVLMNSSLEAMDSQALVRLLAHESAEVRNETSDELRRRKWTAPQIELGIRLVSGGVQDRLNVIDRLAAAQDIDPRQWLVFLMTDADRQIRHRVISILATFDDEAIRRHLRQHELSENDPQIRDLITKRTKSVNPYRR